MARVLRMPHVAEGTAEAVLTEWLVEESALFESAQSLATVETEKLLVSVEVNRPGVLLKTLVVPGAPVDVGMPLAVLGDPGEGPTDLDALLVELGMARGEQHSPQPVSEPAGPPAPRHLDAAPVPDAPVAEVAPAPVVKSVPMPQSVLSPVEHPAPVRRHHRATHTHVRVTVRADRMVDLVDELVRDGAPGVVVEDLVVKAVAAAHLQVPELHPASGTRGTHRQLSVDVGVTAAVGGELVGLVVRDVGAQSVPELGTRIRALVLAATEGRPAPEDLAGASITVSCLGRYGIDEAAATVAPDELASLAVGALRLEPVVEGGAVVPGRVLTLTLSVDHERVDDVVAARWLAVLVALLERPRWMRS